MKALRVYSFDGPEPIRLEDVAEPTPGVGEVKVRVAATAISFVDLLLARGGYQIKKGLPFIAGTEFAGVVTACGPEVDGRIAPGTPVTGTVFGGAWAEYLCATPQVLAPLPPGCELPTASGLAITAATAVHALERRAQLAAGETVLVLAAGGGVGAACVQVAKAIGARVIAGASSAAKRTAALEDGADHAIDTGRADWRDSLRAVAPDGVDVVVDPVGGALTEPAFKSLRWGGRHLVVGFAEGTIPSLRGNLPILKGAAWIGVDLRQLREREPAANHDNLLRTAQLFASGALRPRIAGVYPAGEWQKAIELAGRRETIGRAVLNWSKSDP